MAIIGQSTLLTAGFWGALPGRVASVCVARHRERAVARRLLPKSPLRLFGFFLFPNPAQFTDPLHKFIFRVFSLLWLRKAAVPEMLVSRRILPSISR
jgi:hypothetical protein